MKPILKLSRVISLQDARYAAAEGFDLISFSLLRGDLRKLSVEMIWNMINWLEGPRTIVELDQHSLSELREAQKRFSVDGIAISAKDPLQKTEGVPLMILRLSTGISPKEVEQLLSYVKNTDQEVLFECIAEDLSTLSAIQALFPYLLLGFKDGQYFDDFFERGFTYPRGFSFGEEMEEETGIIDYERMDKILERLVLK